MMTWFDAVLVTLLALVTALGARRGLAGTAWGLGAVGICFVSNLLSGPAALLAALVLGTSLSLTTQRLTQRMTPSAEMPIGHSLLGALGGLSFGLILIFSLALGFPIKIQDNTQIYPSADIINNDFYQAVKNSYIQNSLQKVWVEGQAIQTLLVPDQIKK